MNQGFQRIIVQARGSCRRHGYQAAAAQRSFGSGGGTRGARGHGWWLNYRAGKGGRHLQGEYNGHVPLEHSIAWNDAVFSLGSQFAFLDIAVEALHQSASATNNNDTDSNSKEQEQERDRQRLVLELATAVFPKATENFVGLLEADVDGYASSLLHRVEKKVGLLGGNVWKGTGKCHEPLRLVSSATSMHQTEPLVLSHVPGVLTMTSQRVQEIDSRFLLLSHHAPHLDGKSVAIGRLTPESLDKVQEWESSLITYKGVPTACAMRVEACGLLSSHNNPSDGDDDDNEPAQAIQGTATGDYKANSV